MLVQAGQNMLVDMPFPGGEQSDRAGTAVRLSFLQWNQLQAGAVEASEN